jgi:hypothetical protein
LVSSGFTTNEKIKRSQIISNIKHWIGLRTRSYKKIEAMTQDQYLEYMQESTGQAGRTEECFDETPKPEKKEDKGNKTKKGSKKSKREAPAKAEKTKPSAYDEDEDMAPEIKEDMLERLQTDLDLLAEKKRELEGLDWGQGLIGNMKMIHKF